MSADRIGFRPALPPDPMLRERFAAVARPLALAARAVALAPLMLTRRRRRQPPDPSRVRRLLAVRTDRLGDMALTTAALADLRAHFREAEITVLAPPGPLALLVAHPAVDVRVPLEGRALPRGLEGRFDVAVDFTSDAGLLGALLVRRTGARCRVGLSGGGRQACFTLRGPRASRARHVLDLNRDLAAALGAPPANPRPVLRVTAEERAAARTRLGALGAAAPRVAIHPGGFHPSQRWPAERFAEVIDDLTGRLGAACLVLSGPGEEGLARRICAATPDALAVPTAGVRELMAVLACCDLFVGNNSGPLHVAGALGLPTVSVMGPSDPRRFAPRGPADRVVSAGLPCSPCGRGRCWHHTCLRAIDAGDLTAHLEALLAAEPRREAVL